MEKRLVGKTLETLLDLWKWADYETKEFIKRVPPWIYTISEKARGKYKIATPWVTCLVLGYAPKDENGLPPIVIATKELTPEARRGVINLNREKGVTFSPITSRFQVQVEEEDLEYDKDSDCLQKEVLEYINNLEKCSTK